MLMRRYACSRAVHKQIGLSQLQESSIKISQGVTANNHTLEKAAAYNTDIDIAPKKPENPEFIANKTQVDREGRSAISPEFNLEIT